MSSRLLWTVAIALAAAGAALALRRIQPALRARNAVERTVMVVMMGFSTIAILTTLGVVMSVVYESILFFEILGWRKVSLYNDLSSIENSEFIFYSC